MVLGCILCHQPLVTRIQPGAPCKPRRRVFSKANKSKAKSKSKPNVVKPAQGYSHSHSHGGQVGGAAAASGLHPHPFLAYQPSVNRLGAGAGGRGGPMVNFRHRTRFAAGPAAAAAAPATMMSGHTAGVCGGGGGCTFGETRSPYVPPPPAQNDFEVLAAKCGHMFHRVCLKTYIATRASTGPGSMGNKRPCPFCDKPISFSQCIPVELVVPEEHLILDELSALLQQNESIQQQIEHVRTVVKCDKLRELEALEEEVRVKEREHQLKCVQMHRFQATIDEDEFQQLQQEHQAIEEENEAIAAQNTELITLIEKVVKLRRDQMNEDAAAALVDEDDGDKEEEQQVERSEPEDSLFPESEAQEVLELDRDDLDTVVVFNPRQRRKLIKPQEIGPAGDTEAEAEEPESTPLSPEEEEESRGQTPERPADTHEVQDPEEVNPHAHRAMTPPVEEPEIPEPIPARPKAAARTATKIPAKVPPKSRIVVHPKKVTFAHDYDADIESSSSEFELESNAGSTVAIIDRIDHCDPIAIATDNLPKSNNNSTSIKLDLPAVPAERSNSSVKSIISYLELRPFKIKRMNK